MSFAAQPSDSLPLNWASQFAFTSLPEAPALAFGLDPPQAGRGLHRSRSVEGEPLSPQPQRTLGLGLGLGAAKRTIFAPKRCATFKEGALVRAVSVDRGEGSWRKRKARAESEGGETPRSLVPGPTAQAFVDPDGATPLEEDGLDSPAASVDPEMDDMERKMKQCCVRRARKPTTLISATLLERHVPSYPRVAPAALAHPVLAQSELVPLSCARHRDNTISQQPPPTEVQSSRLELSASIEGGIARIGQIGELRVCSTGTLIDLAQSGPRRTVASPISVTSLPPRAGSEAPRPSRKVFDFSRESVLAEQRMTRAAPISCLLDEDSDMPSPGPGPGPGLDTSAGEPVALPASLALPLLFTLHPQENRASFGFDGRSPACLSAAAPSAVESSDLSVASPLSAMTPSSCLSVSTASLASVRSFGLPIGRHWSTGGSPIAFASPAPSHESSLPTPPPSLLDSYRFQLSPDPPTCTLPRSATDSLPGSHPSSFWPAPSTQPGESTNAYAHKKGRPRIAT